MTIITQTTAQSPVEPLNPATLGFGKVFSPHIFRLTYRDGAWANARIEDLQNLSLHPATSVFHYGQAIFEGLKAYRHDDGSLHLFRPRDNFSRMNQSAQRMCMPTLDIDMSMEALHKLVELDMDWVPRIPGSLYIRPTMIATRVGLGVVPAEEFEFFIITSPCGSYFARSKNGIDTVSVFVCEEYVRAVPGGTGMAKTAGNYAGSLLATRKAIQEGCQQVLFLSSQSPRAVEELGGMNICFVRDNVLVTPSLIDGSILDGVTRRSVMQLASEFMSVSEERIPVDALIAELRTGRVTEVLICGTGAGIVSVSSLKYRGEKVHVATGKVGPVTRKLTKMLTSVQYGTGEDKYQWLDRVL